MILQKIPNTPHYTLSPKLFRFHSYSVDQASWLQKFSEMLTSHIDWVTQQGSSVGKIKLCASVEIDDFHSWYNSFGTYTDLVLNFKNYWRWESSARSTLITELLSKHSTAKTYEGMLNVDPYTDLRTVRFLRTTYRGSTLVSPTSYLMEKFIPPHLQKDYQALLYGVKNGEHVPCLTSLHKVGNFYPVTLKPTKPKRLSCAYESFPVKALEYYKLSLEPLPSISYRDLLFLIHDSVKRVVETFTLTLPLSHRIMVPNPQGGVEVEDLKPSIKLTPKLLFTPLHVLKRPNQYCIKELPSFKLGSDESLARKTFQQLVGYASTKLTFIEPHYKPIKQINYAATS